MKIKLPRSFIQELLNLILNAKLLNLILNANAHLLTLFSLRCPIFLQLTETDWSAIKKNAVARSARGTG